MRFDVFRISLCTLLIAAAFSAGLHAQSYSPKDIRIEGADAYSQADLLAVSGLKRGQTVSIKDIEAALGRLADTGLFLDTRYAVDSQRLILTLTPMAEKHLMPVVYGNFVWWSPGELTPLVHARVPLFTGIVPINGGLLDQVKEALVAILAGKGVTASVDSRDSAAGPGMTLSISSPEIKVGEIRFEGASPDAATRLANVRAKLVGDDFDETTTPKSVINGVEGAYRDDGYLDVAVDKPAHGGPRADGASRFLVDVSATVHGGELYRVSSAEVHGAAPVSAGDLQKLLMIKAGDPASTIEVRTAQNRMMQPYHRAGYLDAETHVDTAKDPTAHRIGYTFTMLPGEQYHVASVQPSGFSPEQQAEFEHSFHVAPNAAFDEAVFMQIGVLNQRHAFNGTRIRTDAAEDRKQHTVAIKLTAVRVPGH